MRLVISQYLTPGDPLTLDVDAAANRLTGLGVNPYLDSSTTRLDPIVGLQLHTPENGKRRHAQVYTEIGGIGAGSTFAWQIFPTIGVSLSRSAAREFGRRRLDVDYETGENTTLFKYDVLTQGSVAGFRFRF